jgi:ubiquinone/menaquinone biosynthesis C-methylase UbiE
MPTTAEQPAERRAQTDRKAWIAHGFDLVAAVYGEASDSFFTGLGEQLVARTGLKPGDRVLDLGCGRGAVLFAAADAVGHDGYAAGIDLSPEMVHATSADAVRRGLRNVAVRVGDAEDPGFPAHSFEAVLAGLMMFITPDPDAALRAARRVLVPGGRFGMTTFGAPEPGWEAASRAALAFSEPGLPAPLKGGSRQLGTSSTAPASPRSARSRRSMSPRSPARSSGGPRCGRRVAGPRWSRSRSNGGRRPGRRPSPWSGPSPWTAS